MSSVVETALEIRPFRVDVPQEELDDLRQRIDATRWPDRETLTDQSQGVQLARLEALARYWGSSHDWRKVEARLNALPQFVMEIDGLQIHFIHVRSRQPDECSGDQDGPDLVARRPHSLSGRRLSTPGKLGPARLSKPDLLPRGGPRRALCGVGTA